MILFKTCFLYSLGKNSLHIKIMLYCPNFTWHINIVYNSQVIEKKAEESCHKLFQLNYPCMRKHGIENFTFSDVK